VFTINNISKFCVGLRRNNRLIKFFIFIFMFTSVVLAQNWWIKSFYFYLRLFICELPTYHSVLVVCIDLSHISLFITFSIVAMCWFKHWQLRTYNSILATLSKLPCLLFINKFDSNYLFSFVVVELKVEGLLSKAEFLKSLFFVRFCDCLWFLCE